MTNTSPITDHNDDDIRVEAIARATKVPPRKRRRLTCPGPLCGGATRPVYAPPGEKAVFCYRDKADGMVDVIHPKCIGPKCSGQKRPSFAFFGEKARFCKEDKEEGMVDVVNPKCPGPICGGKKIPIYAFHGEKARFCKDDKEDSMVDVSNPKCQGTKCNGKKRATFGFFGERPRFCVSDKIEGMVDVVNPKCPGPKCGGEKQPVFAFCGNIAEFCKADALEGMIDVVNRRCPGPKCGGKKQPTFAFQGEIPQFCVEDKSDGMAAVRYDFCPGPNCGGKRRATYALPGEKPHFCREDALENMINVASRRCPGPPDGTEGVLGCPFDIRVSNREAYPSGYCHYCDPDQETRQTRCRTENRVLEELETHHDLVPTDKQFRIDYECLTASSGKFCKVDAVFDTPDVRVLLEIDECGHRGYSSSCDERRMHDATAIMMLSEGENRPIFWVRFNPDETRGHKSSTPSKQRERCALAAAAIKGAFLNPRFGMAYVNY